MSLSIQRMPRPTRRRLKRVVQRSRERNHVRRAMALLHLARGLGVSETARLVCAARSTVQRWRDLYLEYGEAGLVPDPRGRSKWTVTQDVIRKINELLTQTPNDFGYLIEHTQGLRLQLGFARFEQDRLHQMNH